MRIAPARILIVEDDWFSAQDAADAARCAGCAVVGPFPCPVVAAEHLLTEAADAALLDVDVGETTTFDLARQLRDSGVPIVFHSDWPPSHLPPDLAELPLVPKWRGVAAAVAALAGRVR